jgi:hypothetical protein
MSFRPCAGIPLSVHKNRIADQVRDDDQTFETASCFLHSQIILNS